MSSSYALPKAAAEGFHDAGNYDAYRPSYPPKAVEALLNRLRIAGEAGFNLLEIGAGTGKFTELLAAREEDYRIVAVEPHGPMREQLSAKKLGNVEVKDGHAGQVPVEDGWGDACIVAQAFHWFATEESLREIHRALKPEAVLGLIWNIEDYNKPAGWTATTAWEQKLNELVHTLASDGSPRFRDGKWQDVFTNQVERTPLGALQDSLVGNLPHFSLPLGEDRVAWTEWLTPEALWKRFGTLSQVATLQGGERERFQHRFDEIVRGEDVERNENGEVAFHGITYFAWSDRI